MEQYRIHNFKGDHTELLAKQRSVETALAELYETRTDENIEFLESYIREILGFNANRVFNRGDLPMYIGQCRSVERVREERERRRERFTSSERQTLRESYGENEYVKNVLTDSLPVSSDFQSMSSSEIDSMFTMNKLRQYCRENGMKGYGRFTKSELIQQLRE
jgi:hypothetical protein